MSLKKVFQYAAAIAFVVILGAVAFYGVGIANRTKATFSEILVSLVSTRTAAEDFARSKNSVTGIELVERQNLPAHTKDRVFLVLAGGTLVGVDFPQKVVVTLVPVLTSKGLIWKCSMSPDNERPESCSSD